MIINIHWGEFCGEVERTEIDEPSPQSKQVEHHLFYKYKMQLKGYLPFTLFKEKISGQWIANTLVDGSISRQVIFYAKKLIDEFEAKNRLSFL